MVGKVEYEVVKIVIVGITLVWCLEKVWLLEVVLLIWFWKMGDCEIGEFVGRNIFMKASGGDSKFGYW